MWLVAARTAVRELDFHKNFWYNLYIRWMKEDYPLIDFLELKETIFMAITYPN